MVSGTSNIEINCGLLVGHFSRLVGRCLGEAGIAAPANAAGLFEPPGLRAAHSGVVTIVIDADMSVCATGICGCGMQFARDEVLLAPSRGSVTSP